MSDQTPTFLDLLDDYQTKVRAYGYRDLPIPDHLPERQALIAYVDTLPEQNNQLEARLKLIQQRFKRYCLDGLELKLGEIHLGGDVSELEQLLFKSLYEAITGETKVSILMQQISGLEAHYRAVVATTWREALPNSVYGLLTALEDTLGFEHPKPDEKAQVKEIPLPFPDDDDDDEHLDPVTEEFLDAMCEARMENCDWRLSIAIQAWQNDQLIVPQIARKIDESDWPLPDRLNRAHKAFMLDWEGPGYEGRHKPADNPNSDQ